MAYIFHAWCEIKLYEYLIVTLIITNKYNKNYYKKKCRKVIYYFYYWYTCNKNGRNNKYVTENKNVSRLPKSNNSAERENFWKLFYFIFIFLFLFFYFYFFIFIFLF